MYLGIDLGTSEVKVLLIDGRQRIVASAHAPLSIQRPHPLWSEQNPEDWWQACVRALSDIRNRAARELTAVRGIGLSGQMHGAVLLDAAGQVLRPAILWNDARAGAECREMERRVPALRHIAGNLAMPGFTAPKLLWIARHEPALFHAMAKVLLPKDYLRLRLTGEYVSDVSDASGTLWLDVARRDWSDTLLTACDLNRSHMPRLVEGAQASAPLLPQLARQWGMDSRVVVAGGAGDNAASAIGMGVIAADQSFISLGTSGVFFVATDTYRSDPAQGLHTFCHALPGQWHQMGVMLSAASCLRWATRTLHAQNEAELLAEIETANGPVRPDAPLFLPYLSGERTPHNDPHAKGAWFGLDHNCDRGLLGYSVLEGVAFGLRDSHLALRAAGSAAPRAALVGGGSRSVYWARLLASALDLPLTLHDAAGVGAALGAARLGMLAANPGCDAGEVCAPPAIAATIEPDLAWHRALLPRFEKYRRLYAAVQPLFAT